MYIWVQKYKKKSKSLLFYKKNRQKFGSINLFTYFCNIKPQVNMIGKRNENNNNKKEDLYIEAGKYFLDISKLIFGGLILSSIVGMDFDLEYLIVYGFAASFIFALFGFMAIIMARSKNKYEHRNVIPNSLRRRTRNGQCFDYIYKI